MNISGISSSVSTVASLQGAQTVPVGNASDPDGDGDGGRRVHKSHGGGHVHQALMQALQSLGLTVPQGSAGTASSGSTASGGAAATTDASSATGNVKDDLRQFMHALFQAVKGESSTNAGSTASGSADPKSSSFASGLSALISQVTNGSAPAGLQDAFSKLAADLQGSQAAPATTAAAGAPSSAAAAPSLQALLTNLQQDLGYGSSGTTSLGNAVSAQV
jgi:hypothetical protein